MGKEERGGTLIKRTVSREDLCRCCMTPMDGRSMICDDCRRPSMLKALASGDAPAIMSMIAVLLAFVVLGAEKDGPFHINSLYLDSTTWSIALIVLALLAGSIGAIVDFRSAFKRSVMDSTGRVLSPILIVLSPMAIIFEGFEFVTISVWMASTLIGIFWAVLVFRSWRSVRLSDLAMLIGSSITAFFGVFLTDVLIIGRVDEPLVSPSVLAFLGMMSLALAVHRMNRSSTIPTRAVQYHVPLMITIALASIGITFGPYDGGRSSGSMIWFFTLIFLMVSITMMIEKRSMDNELFKVLKMDSIHNEASDEFRDRGELTYGLHHLDMAIASNPIHGMGEDPNNGNVLFRIHGEDGWKDIQGNRDGYVLAHFEKARLLSSRGRLSEALREYKKALSRDPSNDKVHYHMAMVLASSSTEDASIGYDLGLFIDRRKVRLMGLLHNGVPRIYDHVFDEIFRAYVSSIQKKASLLKELSRKGDVMAYYTLLRKD